MVKKGQAPPFHAAQPQCALCWAQGGSAGPFNKQMQSRAVILLFIFDGWKLYGLCQRCPKRLAADQSHGGVPDP